MTNNFGETPRKSDLYAVLLSFLAGIVQLSLFVIGTLGQATNFQRLFVRPDTVPFMVILSLVIALCCVGVISFFRKNPTILPIEASLPTFKPLVWIRKLLFDNRVTAGFQIGKKQEKRNLVIMLVGMLLFAVFFILSTETYLTNKSYGFINSQNEEIYQTLGFIGLWVSSTIVLFAWISDEIEKQYQFRPDDFLSNLVRALQSYGYVQIVISADLQTQWQFHYVSVKIQNEEKYFVVQFDGRRIIEEIDKEKFNSLTQANTSNNPST